MINELGHFALILAFAVAIVQSTVPLIGAQNGWRGWMAVAEPAASAQFLLIAASFAALTHAFVMSDFSLKLVWENSHTDKPMLYKVTGVWGNHEGSMMPLGADPVALWRCSRLVRRGLAAKASSARSRCAGLDRRCLPRFHHLHLEPVPAPGRATLQRRGAEPAAARSRASPSIRPFLYLGYVGLSVTFSFAMAALLEGRVDAAWRAGCGRGRSRPGSF